MRRQNVCSPGRDGTEVRIVVVKINQVQKVISLVSLVRDNEKGSPKSESTQEKKNMPSRNYAKMQENILMENKIK